MNQTPWSRSSLGLLAIALLAGCSAPPTVETVLEQHRQAVRPDNAAPLSSIAMRVRVEEPTFTVSGHYWAMRPDSVRVDIFAGDQRVFSEGIHDGQGWQQGGEGAEVTELSPKGLSALQRGIQGNLYNLDELPALGYHIELRGLRELPPSNGEGSATTPYWELELTTPDGRTDEIFLGHEDFLIHRVRRLEALHPDIDPTESITETVYEDYRQVDGRPRSFRTVKRELDSGNQLQRIDVESIECNPTLDATVFEAPTVAEVPATEENAA